MLDLPVVEALLLHLEEERLCLLEWSVANGFVHFIDWVGAEV